MSDEPAERDWTYCQQCGQQLRPDAGFCDRCGAEQQDSEHSPPASTAQPSREDADTSLVTRRRLVVAGAGGVGTLAVGAFALGVLDSSDDPAYEPGNKESLLPGDPGSDWPDADLVRDDSVNDSFDRVYQSSDGMVAILVGAEIYETVPTAKSSFDSRRATYSSSEEYTIADESIVAEESDNARCIWRRSNATGSIVAARGQLETVPDRARATRYANFVYANYW